jgi:hypothetical protein
MRNEEIKAELAALRAEVVALAEARKQAPEAHQPSEPPESSVLATDQGTSSETEHEGFMGQVQELVELLEHELRETPVVSGLAIFSLGILVGRFLR